MHARSGYWIESVTAAVLVSVPDVPVMTIWEVTAGGLAGGVGIGVGLPPPHAVSVVTQSKTRAKRKAALAGGLETAWQVRRR